MIQGEEPVPSPVFQQGKSVMALEKELSTYRQVLPQLLAHPGKFVVIHQEEIAGVFGTYADAVRAGYERFGLDPFLVKQIEAVERVRTFTRDLKPPCRS
jgi:hypothetical protein